MNPGINIPVLLVSLVPGLLLLAYGWRSARRNRRNGSAAAQLDDAQSARTRLDEAQRLARIGSWELDLVTNHLVWSDEIFRIFEIDKDRFPATYEGFLNTVHPDDRDLVNSAYTESVKNRIPYDITHRLQMSDGRIKHVNERCETFYDAAGNPVRSIGTVQDVTARVIVEQQLAEARERVEAFQKFAEAAGQGVGMARVDGTILYGNPALQRILGMEPTTDFEHYNINDFFTDADRALLNEISFPSVMRDGHWTGELPLKRADGTTVPVIQSIFLLRNTMGEPVVFGNVVTDLTEQKKIERERLIAEKALEDLAELKRAQDELQKSQNLLSSIIENMPAMLFLKKASDLRFEMLNRTGEEILGISRAQFIGKNDYDFFPKEQADFFTSFDRKVLNEGKVTDIPEEPVLTRSGDTRYFYTRKIGLFDEAGAPTHLLGMSVDITERKQVAEELMKAKEAAETASRAKSEFLSHMSHELRTPLTAILGFTQLLELDESLTTDQRKCAKEIASSGRHLLALVDDVLDLSKIEYGSVRINMGTVLLNELVAECIATTSQIASAAKVSIRLEENSRAVATADPIRLKQILLNLLTNAIKYNHAGGKVTIGAEATGNGKIHITVSDTGKGISTEMLPKLFLPFDRLGAEGSGIDGMGIGLALSKRLVELMGGSITAENIPGGGARFSVDLLSAVPGEELSASRLQPTGSRLMGIGEKKLLYVEDNPANQQLMKNIMERRKDISMTLATNAEQGLRLAESGQPDLIIMDVNLPGMTGVQAVRLLRNNPATRGIPVIALSGNAMSHDISAGLSAGFSEYLIKPFDVVELLGIIDRWMLARDRS